MTTQEPQAPSPARSALPPQVPVAPVSLSLFSSTSSDEIGKIAFALSRAQGAFGEIPKGREVTVRTKAGTVYTFAYAPLDIIINATRNALCENELATSQLVLGKSGSRPVIKTVLMHSSGQWLASTVEVLGEVEDPQKLGSGITYMRRYAFQSILGVIAEDDDDGNAAEGNTIEGRRDRPQRERPAQSERPTPRLEPPANRPPARDREASPRPPARQAPPASAPPAKDPKDPPQWREVPAHARAEADISRVDGTGKPSFFREKMPIGKEPREKGWTWDDMTQGSPDGKRREFLIWLATEFNPSLRADGKPTPPQYVAGNEIVVARAQTCLRYMREEDEWARAQDLPSKAPAETGIDPHHDDPLTPGELFDQLEQHGLGDPERG